MNTHPYRVRDIYTGEIKGRYRTFVRASRRVDSLYRQCGVVRYVVEWASEEVTAEGLKEYRDVTGVPGTS